MSTRDNRPPGTYREAGVDVDRADRFVDYIKGLRSPALGKAIGAFAAGVPIPAGTYRNPLLVSTTDGVGTKILVARHLGDFTTIGIDLVAMSVNDLAVCGARPVSFLDYIACGAIHETILQDVIDGVVRGCELAGCTLAGGETAEMPDLYDADDIDLAGFCAGIVEADEMLPRLREIRKGAAIFGLPSSGVHSNGLSLARKVIPTSEPGLWSELLTPTRIYVRELETLIAGGSVLAAAHITGGGLEANLRRVVPQGLYPKIHWDWSVPPIFEAIERFGSISREEMRKVFNMGIGVALVVNSPDIAAFESASEGADFRILRIGEVTLG